MKNFRHGFVFMSLSGEKKTYDVSLKNLQVLTFRSIALYSLSAMPMCSIPAFEKVAMSYEI